MSCEPDLSFSSNGAELMRMKPKAKDITLTMRRICEDKKRLIKTLLQCKIIAGPFI